MPATRNQKEQKITAIITDLGGVLVKYNKMALCEKIAKYSELTAEEIASHFSDTKLTKENIDFGKGLITPVQFFERICKSLKLSGISFENASEIYCSGLSRKDDSIALLRRLQKKYVLALLSNTDALHFAECSRILGQDLGLFNAVILSFEVHSAKPSAEIYVAALDKLKMDAQDCVYVDDIQEYVAAANKVGMHGLHFVSPAQLETDLKKLGVSI